MSAPYITVDINFLLFYTFSSASRKFEPDLPIAEDAPMLSEGETVAPNSTSVPFFLWIFAV